MRRLIRPLLLSISLFFSAFSLFSQSDSVQLALEQTVAGYEKACPSGQEPPQCVPLANAYCALGEYHQHQNQYEAASSYAEKAMAIADQSDDKPMRVRSYLLASACAEHQPGKEEFVLGYSLKALQEARTTTDSALILAAYTRVTSVYVQKKDYKTADSYVQEAHEFFKDLKNKALQAHLQLYQGLFDLDSERPQQALEHLQHLVETTRDSLVDLNTQLKAYRGLEKAATAIGDLRNAQRYRKIADDLVARRQTESTQGE